MGAAPGGLEPPHRPRAGLVHGEVGAVVDPQVGGPTGGAGDAAGEPLGPCCRGRTRPTPRTAGRARRPVTGSCGGSGRPPGRRWRRPGAAGWPPGRRRGRATPPGSPGRSPRARRRGSATAPGATATTGRTPASARWPRPTRSATDQATWPSSAGSPSGGRPGPSGALAASNIRCRSGSSTLRGVRPEHRPGGLADHLVPLRRPQRRHRRRGRERPAPGGGRAARRRTRGPSGARRRSTPSGRAAGSAAMYVVPSAVTGTRTGSPCSPVRGAHGRPSSVDGTRAHVAGAGDRADHPVGGEQHLVAWRVVDPLGAPLDHRPPRLRGRQIAGRPPVEMPVHRRRASPRRTRSGGRSPPRRRPRRLRRPARTRPARASDGDARPAGTVPSTTARPAVTPRGPSAPRHRRPSGGRRAGGGTRPAPPGPRPVPRSSRRLALGGRRVGRSSNTAPELHPVPMAVVVTDPPHHPAQQPVRHPRPGPPGRVRDPGGQLGDRFGDQARRRSQRAISSGSSAAVTTRHASVSPRRRGGPTPAAPRRSRGPDDASGGPAHRTSPTSAKAGSSRHDVGSGSLSHPLDRPDSSAVTSMPAIVENAGPTTCPTRHPQPVPRTLPPGKTSGVTAQDGRSGRSRPTSAPRPDAPPPHRGRSAARLAPSGPDLDDGQDRTSGDGADVGPRSERRWCTLRGLGRVQRRVRVERGPVRGAELEVQMRDPDGVAGVAHEPDDLAGLTRRPELHRGRDPPRRRRSASRPVERSSVFRWK